MEQSDMSDSNLWGEIVGIQDWVISSISTRNEGIAEYKRGVTHTSIVLRF